jgi:ATP-binding cassette subfamily C protein CydD
MPDQSTLSATGLLKSQRRYAGHFLSMAVLLALLNGLLLVLQSWWLAKFVSSVITGNAGLEDNYGALTGLLLLLVLRAALVWLAEQSAFRAAVAVKLHLRDRLFTRLLQLGPTYLQGERSGKIVNTLIEGIEALEAYYARYLPAMSLMVLLPLSILVFVFPLDWVSGLILLGTAPLIPLFMILIGKGAARLNQRQWQRMARLSAHFLDVIQGLTTLKLFNLSRREADTVARISDEYRRDTMSVLRLAFLSSLTLEFFATISIAVVAVLIGFRLLWGEMDFQQGFFILLLAPEFYFPLRNMGVHYHARMAAVAAAEQMAEIFDEPVMTSAGNRTFSLEAPPEIQFRDIHFQYQDERVGLSGLNLTIPTGETLAIVGPTGSGKTTLIRLLLGFMQPQHGEILIDGQRLDNLDLECWRQQLAWVPQQPRLFHGSLRENLTMGQVKASEAQISAVLKQARVEEFMHRFPEGLDTVVNETGRGLSGGQIQRIALARAFLRDASVVIMDEATANLDRENERLVVESMQALATRRTYIMIAHRLETVQWADRIIVLSDGKVVESGNHENLLKQDGVYAAMCRSGRHSDD